MPESVSSAIDGMDEHIKRTVELLEKTDLDAVSALVDKLYEAYREGSRVFICGNGGSAATASHFSEDLAKSTIKDHTVQKRLRVSSLRAVSLGIEFVVVGWIVHGRVLIAHEKMSFTFSKMVFFWSFLPVSSSSNLASISACSLVILAGTVTWICTTRLPRP